MKRSLAIVAGVLVLAVAACGGANPTAAPDEAAPPEATAVPTSTAGAPAVGETAAAASTPESPTPTAVDSAGQGEGPRQTGEVEGITFVVSEGSEATFTVEEQLQRLPLPNDAVLRTTALSGEVRLDGGASIISIDLHELSSDQQFRDRYVRTAMFPNDPIATFTVDSVGPLPSGFTDGGTVSTQVSGALTVRGVEVPMTFEIEARDDGDVVHALGRTQFTWDQLSIKAPTALSVVWVAEEVSVEVLLTLRPADS